MSDQSFAKGYISNDEFENFKYRLSNILFLNQYRLYLDKKVEKKRRIDQSMSCGSLCTNPNTLPGEEWLSYNSDKNIKISNYGRVKYNKNIAIQKDENDRTGWLVLEDENLRMLVKEKYLFQTVSKTFFTKPDKMGYQIHHITNNGYDNSVGNLIYLTEDQHKEVEKSVTKYMKWQ